MIKPLKIITGYDYYIEACIDRDWHDKDVLYQVKKGDEELSAEYDLERALKYIAKLVLLDRYANEEHISIGEYTSELILLENELLRNVYKREED